MTTREMREALRYHHASMNDAWVVLFEPFGIDALALSQSRGRGKVPYRRISYEIKASRADFRRELDAWPGKAALALDLAHAYVFVTPEGLLSDAERQRREPEMTEPMGDAGLRSVLTTRGRRETLYVPYPAGLLEVSDDKRCRLRVRPTYGPTPREWTDKEVAYIAAYAWRPNIILTAEQSNYEARGKLVELTRTLSSAQQWHEKARAALEGYAPLLVQLGQVWQVPGGWAPPIPVYGPGDVRTDWQGNRYGGSHRPAMYSEEPVDCEIIEVCSHGYGEARARLRRLDTGHESEPDWYEHEGKRYQRHSGMPLSELLVQAERIDREVPATVTDLAARRRR